jgi:hypothetical protein
LGSGLPGNFTARVLAQGTAKAKPVGKWVEPKTLMPVWKGAKMTLPGRPQKIQTYEPDPYSPGEPDANLKLASIQLPGADANEESTSLIVNAIGRRALVSYWTPGRTGAGTARLVMCDLVAGKMLDSVTVPTAAVPMALSDDGEHVAIRFLPEAGPGQESHLEVWNWSAKGISRTIRFLPHDDSLKLNERFTFAAFLDDSRLATLTTMKQLIVWEWRNAKMILVFDKYNPFCDISRSPNGKYLFATARNTSLAVIDTASFDYAGYYNPFGQTDDFRIHPSGTQVLTSSVDGINRVGEGYVRTIPNDRTTSYFPMTPLGLGRLLAFPNNDALYESIDQPAVSVKSTKPANTKPAAKTKSPAKKNSQLVGTIAIQDVDEETKEDLGQVVHRIDSTKVSQGKVTLVDLQHRVRAWEYTAVDRLAAVGPLCWCLTRPEKGQSASLVPLELPGPELKEQVAQIVAEPEYHLLKDGGVVKVNLSGLPAKDREAAIPVLEKQLKFKNVTIGDTSDLELVTKVGPYRVIDITSLAQVGNTLQARFGSYTHRQLTVEVELLLRGQPVYSKVLAKELSLLDKRPNETPQQFYDRNPGTPIEILGTLNLPKVIFGPNGNKPLGSTNMAQVAGAQ